MSGGGGSITEYGASQQLASILAQQFQNYHSVYTPLENQQIAWATNPSTLLNAQTQAGATADRSSAAAATGLQKDLETRGIRLAPDQLGAVQRRLGLNAGLSRVDAMNRAGANTYDTITQVLSGGAPNVSGLAAGSGATPPANPGA